MNTNTFQERPCIEWGVAARALPGQAVSGDLHLVKPFSKGVLLAAVDGLGHGDEATLAAQLAVTTLERNAEESWATNCPPCAPAFNRFPRAICWSSPPMAFAPDSRKDWRWVIHPNKSPTASW